MRLAIGEFGPLQLTFYTLGRAHAQAAGHTVDPGEWAAGSKAEFKYAVDVTYYKLEIDGRVMFEIDPINCVRVIDGVDQLADVRNALGL